ncbi:MAG: hypothetical protein ACRD98_09760 [Nitrososphaera sp.]
MENHQGAAGNIILILANLPDFLRKPMLQSRMKEFFAMTEAERREMIDAALAAAPAINPAKLAVLVKTWLEVISDFDPEKRMLLFRAYSEQILTKPESMEGFDIPSLTQTFVSLDAKHQEKIIDSLHEVLFSTPNRAEILKLIPEDMQRALKLKS